MAEHQLFSNARLRAMYEDEKKALREIVAITGLKMTTLRRRLKQAGAKMRGQSEAWRVASSRDRPLLTRANIRRLYMDGERTMEQTAAELRVSIDTLRSYMDRMGIPRRRSSYSAYAESRYELVIDEAALVADYTVRFMPIARIARKHGISRITVTKRLVANGVTIRPRGAGSRALYAMARAEASASDVQETKRCSKAA